MDAKLQALRRIAVADNTSEAWRQYAAALERREGASQDSSEPVSDIFYLGLNRTQMKTLVDACDMYSRVLIGQFGRISEEFRMQPAAVEAEYGPCDSWSAHNLLNNAVKQCIYPNMPANGSMGIQNPLTPVRAQRAYDIHQVLRHRLAWDNTREQGEEGRSSSVWHYVPSKTGDEPIPPLLAAVPCHCDDTYCPHSKKLSNES
jgi:hypothetical protein